MSARTHVRVPKYRLHKPTGLAVVRLSGRDLYLGPYGTPESETRYESVVAEWLKHDRRLPPKPERVAERENLLVNELILAYVEFANGYYVKGGKPTGELHNVRDALRVVATHFGSMRAKDFGPVELRKVRDAMVAAGLCRKVVNSRINRIRRMFKWGVEHGRVDPVVLHGLQAVSPLREGRSSARETAPVAPVPEELIEPVLQHVPRQVAAMIRLQYLTGMRPGEVMSIRTCDVDRTGRIWIYRPSSHKTEHFGRARLIHIGPQAQAVLEPFLKEHVPEEFVFSPQEAVRELRIQRRLRRKTRPTPSELARRRMFRPKEMLGNLYTRRSYAVAIARGCRKAFPIPKGLKESEKRDWVRSHHWSPNRLRHNAATFLRKQFGIEAARVVLGHTSAGTTEIYAELDARKAAEVMEKVG